jgi:hypothetical protein
VYLIWCTLLAVVKHICAKIGTNTSFCCIGRAIIILASTSTTSTAIGATTTDFTATFVSSSSTTNLEKYSEIYANVTADKKD